MNEAIILIMVFMPMFIGYPFYEYFCDRQEQKAAMKRFWNIARGEGQ